MLYPYAGQQDIFVHQGQEADPDGAAVAMAVRADKLLPRMTAWLDPPGGSGSAVSDDGAPPPVHGRRRITEPKLR